MRRRTVLALTFLLGLAGAAGLAARTNTPPGVSGILWNIDINGFGGWSGIDVSADGNRFWALSDSATITTGTLLREHGQLVGVNATAPRWVKGESTRLNLYSGFDAEGLSIQPDESMVVSYEGFHRVWHHADWRAFAERIPGTQAFQPLGPNSSLEAVAVDADGVIFTLPELADGDGHSYPMFRYDGTGWDQPFALERKGFWRAVGADFGPDGRLYLLERQFLGVGFISQVRRFDLTGAAGILTGDVLYRSPLGRHGNLEGIGIWKDDDGFIRAVMISDDNYYRLQRNEIVEVILPE